MENDWNDVKKIASHINDNIELVSDRVLQSAFKNVPAYAELPYDEVSDTQVGNVARIIKSLEERRGPNKKDIEQTAAVAETRAKQNIALEEIIQAFQAVVKELFDIFIELAVEREVSDSVKLEVSNIFWLWTNQVTLPLSRIHRATELERVRFDESERQDFIRGLVAGNIPSSELLAKARAYSLNIDEKYYAFVGAQLDSSEHLHTIYTSIRPKDLSLSAIFDGYIFGVAKQKPTLRTKKYVVGVGFPSTLRSISKEYSSAEKVMETAKALGRGGVYGMADIALEVAIYEQKEIGDILEKKYLGPLIDNYKKYDDILSAIDMYFQESFDINKAAKKMKVHPNTLRYRLMKYEEVCGISLSDIKTLSALWWILNYRNMR